MCENCCPKGLDRRSFMLMAGAGLIAVSGARPAQADALPKTDAPNAIAPDEALQRLVAGNRRYVANGMHCKDMGAGRAARVEAQYPIASIVSCSDSRVVPEFAFDQGPGDLFLVRVAGNFVNEDGLASLEYGADVLGAPLVVVLGHRNCGAVAAAIKVIKTNAALPGHLPGLIDSLKPAVLAAQAKNPPDLLAAAIEENVRRNVARLQTAKPVLAEKAAAGRLKIVGGVYDLADGKIAWV